jgi:predicted Zn-dependent protease
MTRSDALKLGVLGGILGLLALTGLSIYFWLVPALAGAAARLIPKSWEETMGAAVSRQIAPPGQRCEDPRLLKALDEIVERLEYGIPAPAYRFRVAVLDTPEVNALAAPGGHIVVFRGLLERADRPEQLAGVLAHELQHVLLRHSTRAIVREMFFTLLVAWLFGGGDLESLVGAAHSLGALHFARSQEEEADREGMKMLLAARVDPEGMIEMFEKLAESSRQLPGFLSYLSTHPDTKERIGALRQMMGPAVDPPRNLLPGVDWGAVRRACHGPDR